MALITPRRHFDEDIRRAEAMLALAKAQEEEGADERLVDDLRLSSVSVAVGALDAFLCDLYVDCLTSVLRAYRNGRWEDDLPAHYARQQLPAGEVLDSSRSERPLWSIRMAARSVMERDNMLKLSRIPDHFNGILPEDAKLWAGVIDAIASHNHRRLTKYQGAELAALSGSKLGAARKKVAAAVRKRIGEIVQIRHDWIHNCGRPKEAIMTLTQGAADVRIKHVKWFVVALSEHVQKHRKV